MNNQNYSNATNKLLEKISTLENELKVTKEKLNSKENCQSLTSSGKVFYQNKETTIKQNLNYYTDLWKEIHKNFPE